MRALHEHWRGDASELRSTVRSLNTLLDLDLAIIEDAYQKVRSEAAFRTLVEAAPCMIVLLRPDHTIAYFSRRMFGDETRVRFKPHYFPFTEPSVDVDMTCFACAGRGCKLCGGSGWIEIMGAGMVHPRVLASANVDPERYTGFAFGMGPGRIALNRYGIPDIRLLYEGDMRFLEQFGGQAVGRPEGR